MKQSSKRRREKRYFLYTVLVLLIIIFAVNWNNIYTNVYLKTAYPEKYSNIVTLYAGKSKLDPNLVYAVIRTESSFNPNAESQIGAMGLMQITPPTFEWAMDKTPQQESYSDADLYAPEVNVHYGTLVLSAFITEFGNEETALAAYNAGRSNVIKWLADSRYSKDGKTLYYIPFTQTREYVKRVEESKKMYTDLYKPKSSE